MVNQTTPIGASGRPLQNKRDVWLVSLFVTFSKDFVQKFFGAPRIVPFWHLGMGCETQTPQGCLAGAFVWKVLVTGSLKGLRPMVSCRWFTKSRGGILGNSHSKKPIPRKQNLDEITTNKKKDWKPAEFRYPNPTRLCQAPVRCWAQESPYQAATRVGSLKSLVQMVQMRPRVPKPTWKIPPSTQRSGNVRPIYKMCPVFFWFTNIH